MIQLQRGVQRFVENLCFRAARCKTPVDRAPQDGVMEENNASLLRGQQLFHSKNHVLARRLAPSLSRRRGYANRSSKAKWKQEGTARPTRLLSFVMCNAGLFNWPPAQGGAMAIARQEAVLREGSAAWNEWRAKHATEAIDLGSSDLSGLDLSAAQLA